MIYTYLVSIIELLPVYIILHNTEHQETHCKYRPNTITLLHIIALLVLLCIPVINCICFGVAIIFCIALLSDGSLKIKEDSFMYNLTKEFII